ncbi:hypothetical protein EMIHUDRAFT_210638 [Emiliania huxleyi CCMP1516]|uniref:Uncharacterized protein n=2 Tax=Emiliania huxleyi TaxID=2903 RepID=A0A0D3IYG2_EMIH1|nr:hypothetical protein EMIHUDRAFT_210638 [Emiliania huxleyi CCMP1516]EOD16297.1 hypothetical protein EMIHUDRAFT_210638 [Emiliania huxleyi CCMP1516]|eukprot:XP_005768726.1 hypothetical protein EMIHUDRAFT_210638 [Emiliania huxleyi CCMP1516]
MLLRSHASALAALSLACCPSVRSAPHSHNEWAVVFDGGSTGTRVYVYEYTLVPGGLPSLHAEKAWNLKVKPGLSSFSDRPREVGSGYLTSLLDFAAGIVPRTKQARAKVLLRATAGMRLVPTEAAEVIYDSLFAAVRAHGAFQPERSLFGTLSGEDEGVFGWLSVNQLLVSAERLPASKLGQASACEQVPVFTHSHLGFGNKQALAALSEQEAADCFAGGRATRIVGPGGGARLVAGRGDSAACEAGVQRVLKRLEPHGERQGRAREGGRREAVAMRCFDLTYATSLLTHGYGFSEQASEVEWTRGALLAHLMGGSSGAGAEKKAGGAKGRGNLSETGPNRVAVVFGVVLAAAACVLLLRRQDVVARRRVGHPPYGMIEKVDSSGDDIAAEPRFTL